MKICSCSLPRIGPHEPGCPRGEELAEFRRNSKKYDGFESDPVELAKLMVALKIHSPVQDVVTEVEELLEHARSGKVRSVAFVTINGDGSCSTVHAGTSSLFALVGALRLLEHEILAKYRG